MLDVFIIKKIREEEERRKRDAYRPHLEIPLAPETPPEHDEREDEDSGRGVAIIGEDE
ncbi:MAG: hypothetical protein FJ088_06555 [Deltaproteobacteria bacterium]|nr:hypothetical protein [Deltaproteobacteria bacterium]